MKTFTEKEIEAVGEAIYNSGDAKYGEILCIVQDKMKKVNLTYP